MTRPERLGDQQFVGGGAPCLCDLTPGPGGTWRPVIQRISHDSVFLRDVGTRYSATTHASRALLAFAIDADEGAAARLSVRSRRRRLPPDGSRSLLLPPDKAKGAQGFCVIRARSLAVLICGTRAASANVWQLFVCPGARCWGPLPAPKDSPPSAGSACALIRVLDWSSCPRGRTPQ